MSEELKPCPHCGKSDELYPAYRGMGGGSPYAIDCLNCGYDFMPREGIDVFKLWNRRASAQEGMWEALEALIKLHRGPVEAKRPDIFEQLILNAEAALAKARGEGEPQ